MFNIFKMSHIFAVTSHVLICVIQRRPCSRFLPKRAWAVALCVMGGRQRLFGGAYIPKRARAVALYAMGYGLAEAGDSIKNQLVGLRLYFKFEHFIQKKTNIMLHMLFHQC